MGRSHLSRAGEGLSHLEQSEHLRGLRDLSALAQLRGSEKHSQPQSGPQPRAPSPPPAPTRQRRSFPGESCTEVPTPLGAHRAAHRACM